MKAAVEALRSALLEGADLSGVRRTIMPVDAGELLIMPAASPRAVGTKVISVAHHNVAIGKPRIQGVYLLMDAATLTPMWQTDAAELTVLRTTAMSMAGASSLLELSGRSAVDLAIVWGTGPQAVRHVQAIAELGLAKRCAVAGRSIDGVTRVVTECRESSARLEVAALQENDLGVAGLIFCCTASATPLFDDASATRLRSDAIIVAIGSHRAEERELPTSLMGRAAVVVDGPSAIDSAGDIVMAARELGHAIEAITFGEMLRGTATARPYGPWVFKTVGEAWQDLAVAESLAAVTDPRK